jgi:hypothetical protein
MSSESALPRREEPGISRAMESYINPFLGGKRVPLIIEIGVFHGGTTNLLCDKYLAPGGKVIGVDPLSDGVYVPIEPGTPETIRKIHHSHWKAMCTKQYEAFVANTARNADKIELVRMASSEAFPELLAAYEGKVDLIYVDGDHRAAAVWKDATNSFRLCRVGGLILFDDYLWRKGQIDPELTPLPAIDRFLAEYKGKIEVLKKGWRVMVRKVAE